MQPPWKTGSALKNNNRIMTQQIHSGHSSIVHNSPKVEATSVPVDGCGIYIQWSIRVEREGCIATCYNSMNLENVELSERSQTQRDNYRMLLLT